MKKLITVLAILAMESYPILLCLFAVFFGILSDYIIFALLSFFALCLFGAWIITSFVFDIWSCKRLSPFFIEHKIPLLKASVISQHPKRSELSCKTCPEILKELSDVETIKHNLKPNWTYLAVTHQTVIKRLRKSSVDIIWSRSCYRQSLKSTQEKFLKGLCKRCPTTKFDCCRILKYGAVPRQFYLVKFRTAASA